VLAIFLKEHRRFQAREEARGARCKGSSRIRGAVAASRLPPCPPTARPPELPVRLTPGPPTITPR
jgi:hypothetical protein